MTISFLGDGLIFEDMLPLAWLPDAPAQTPTQTAAPPHAQAHALTLARLNADNQQLLVAESSLDEVRVSEALKDESPALLHELQRLEYKLNLLLRLTAEIAVRSVPLPQASRARLGARGLEWFGPGAPAQNETGLVHIFINSALPQPLKIPCNVAGERREAGERVAQLQFRDLSEGVVDLLEKLIFRHHRRLVAGGRTAVPAA